MLKFYRPGLGPGIIAPANPPLFVVLAIPHTPLPRKQNVFILKHCMLLYFFANGITINCKNLNMALEAYQEGEAEKGFD